MSDPRGAIAMRWRAGMGGLLAQVGTADRHPTGIRLPDGRRTAVGAAGSRTAVEAAGQDGSVPPAAAAHRVTPSRRPPGARSVRALGRTRRDGRRTPAARSRTLQPLDGEQNACHSRSINRNGTEMGKCARRRRAPTDPRIPDATVR